MGWKDRLASLTGRFREMREGRATKNIRRLSAEQDAVEKAAREFLSGGVSIEDPPDTSESALDITPESHDLGKRAARRMAKRLLVRFGRGAPEHPGVTANLSENGLFIITDRPAPTGQSVSIDLRLPTGPLPLSGEVVWIRERREPGRSVGFAVHLKDRPVRYVHDLHALESHTR